METRQRRRNDDGAPTPGPDGVAPGGHAEDQRQAARRLARAGREAVDRALTPGQSREFLAATRQQGGQ